MKFRSLACIVLILAICLLIPLTVLPEAAAPLALSESAVEIARGRNTKITAAYDTEAYGNKVRLTWATSDTTVATVANGAITGRGIGNAEVTCHAEFPDGTGADAVCKVSIYQPIAAITVKSPNMTVAAGKTVIIEHEIKPADATYPAVTWSTSDPEIATVGADGTVTGVNPGKAVITGEANEPGAAPQKAVKVNVTVTRGVESVHIAPMLKVARGKGEKLICAVAPEDATDQRIIWTSSDPKVATAANGMIRGVGTGVCMITAEAADGSGTSSTCQVVVVQEVTGIRPNANRFVVFEGEKGKVAVTVMPDNATDPSVTYESENTAVATVDENGTITGVKAGTCTILVTAKDGSGKTARCNVLVEPNIALSAETFRRSGYFGYYNEYGISFKNLTKTKTIRYFSFNLKYSYSGQESIITGNYLDCDKIASGRTSQVWWWKLQANILTYANNFKLYLTEVRFTDGTSRSYGSDGVLIGWFN